MESGIVTDYEPGDVFSMAPFNLHTVGKLNIRTTYEFPPIPDRRFDWSAIDDDTYDGAEDSHCPIGRGPTEQTAIDDLIEQLEENLDG